MAKATSHKAGRKKSGSLTAFGMTGQVEIRKRKMEIGKSGGAVEFDGGGVAEGVEDAERVGWKLETGK